MPTKVRPPKNPLNVAFGRAVQRFRGEKLTVEELGWEIDMDRAHLTKLENGGYSPRLDTIVRIAGALKVPPAELIDATMQEFKKEERRQARKKTTEPEPPKRKSS